MEATLAIVYAAASSLAIHPTRGKPGIMARTRELVAFDPYTLVYELSDDTVLVLRIIHAPQETTEF